MPRRFRFRFETLLRVRQRLEDLKAEALAAVLRDIHRAERQRDEIEQQQRETLRRAGETARQRFDADEVRRYYQYERHLARLAVEKDALIAELRTVERTRRAELEEAMKRRRIVERLRDRRQATHAKVMNREEQLLSDEAATNLAAITRLAGRGR